MMLLSFFIFTALLGPADTTATVLVESEQAFCRAAMTHGIREAFLTFLADESVVFRPGPVPGKKAYRDGKPTSAQLTWRPVWAEIARSGDLGYTTGPWEFRKANNEPAAGYGQYVSIWRKQTDGKWQVILDAGIEHPTGDTISRGVSFAADPEAFNDGAVDTATTLESLMAQERLFSGASESGGFVDALLERARADIRLYRGGRPPVVGAVNVRGAISNPGGPLTWKPTGGAVSRFGDLGYTFGVALVHTADGKAEQLSYVRIWRRHQDGKWKVVLDLTLPSRG